MASIAAPSSLAQIVQSLLTTRYSELASSIIILYDHLVTLDQEVELIWKAGWSFGKCLFLLNRYYTLLVVIFNNYVLFSNKLTNEVPVSVTPGCAPPPGVQTTLCRCVSWFQWQSVSGIVAFTLGELILQLRLYALYGLNRKVMAVVGFVFVASVTSSATIIAIALANVKVSTLTLFGLSFCNLLNLQEITYIYAFWIPMMMCESLLCLLVILKAVHGWKRQSNLLDTGKEIIAVLIRDSIIYFVVLFVVYLTNIIMFVGGDVVKFEAAVNYAVSMSCVMSSRLCLNVRGMIWHDEDIVVTAPATLPLSLQSRCSRWSRSRDAGSRGGGGTGRSQASEHSSVRPTRQKGPIIAFAHPDAEAGLSEIEMDELRSMRVVQHENHAYPLALKLPGKSDGRGA